MPGDCRASFSIYLNDVLLAQEQIGSKTWRELCEKTYVIPDALCTGQEFVTVKFVAGAKECTGRIVTVKITGAV